MAYIERRGLLQRDQSGLVRKVVRYKVRYRDHAGKAHSEVLATHDAHHTKEVLRRLA